VADRICPDYSPERLAQPYPLASLAVASSASQLGRTPKGAIENPFVVDALQPSRVVAPA
jgi:hypothetical protein